jgi:TonB family protein
MGRSALIAFICAGTAGAQNIPAKHALVLACCDQATNMSVAHSEGVVAPVVLMQCRQPEYTQEARIAHLAGIVTMSLTVDDEGIPNDIHVVSPVGLGLDENAVACMRQSRYSPAQKDGKPVPLKINVSLPFQEHWDSDWHLSAAVFRTADGAARPTVVKAKFPEAAGDRRAATVCVHLTVGKDGTPRDVQIPSPQDARLDKEAIAMVEAWRFRPGTQNRQPVDVPATLTLVHGIAARTAASRQ